MRRKYLQNAISIVLNAAKVQKENDIRNRICHFLLNQTITRGPPRSLNASVMMTEVITFSMLQAGHPASLPASELPLLETPSIMHASFAELIELGHLGILDVLAAPAVLASLALSLFMAHVLAYFNFLLLALTLLGRCAQRSAHHGGY